MLKDLKRKKLPPVLLGVIFIVIVPWILTFTLDLMFLNKFSDKVYVYKKGFCFENPNKCQVVEDTLGDLNFYCQQGQSAKLIKQGEISFLDNPAKILSSKKNLEVLETLISYEGYQYKFISTSKKDEKKIELVNCNKSLEAK